MAPLLTGGKRQIKNLQAKIMSNNTNDKKDHRQEDELKIYGPAGSTLQTPEEHAHDQQVDPRKDNRMEVSNDDLRESDIDKFRKTMDGKRGDTEIDDVLSNER